MPLHNLPAHFQQVLRGILREILQKVKGLGKHKPYDYRNRRTYDTENGQKQHIIYLPGGQKEVVKNHHGHLGDISQCGKNQLKDNRLIRINLKTGKNILYRNRLPAGKLQIKKCLAGTENAGK